MGLVEYDLGARSGYHYPPAYAQTNFGLKQAVPSLAQSRHSKGRNPKSPTTECNPACEDFQIENSYIIRSCAMVCVLTTQVFPICENIGLGAECMNFLALLTLTGPTGMNSIFPQTNVKEINQFPLECFHIDINCNMLKSSFSGDKIEAGCDEVGRGCLAGPVVAAAVILPLDYKHKLLTDSKKLSKSKRGIIKKEILNDAVAYSISEVSHEEVDRINVLQASILGMHRALDQLIQRPELILVDGNRFIPYKNILHHCIIKGDGKYLSIAAASILAKTYRDDLMEKLSISHPEYGWERNVGYPTKEHRKAIENYGITPYHRKSFRLLPNQLELFK